MLRPMIVKRLMSLTGGLLLFVTGCGGSEGQENPGDVRGEVATWNIDPDRPPASDDRSFIALVQRLDCASGETGEVLAPEVVERDDEVVVTFEVQMLPPGDYTCRSNKPVPYTVELSAPLAGRKLVDGACLSGEAATTSHCVEGARRWPSPPR